MIRRILILIGAAIGGIVLGAVSFWTLTGPLGHETHYGPWTTTSEIGQTQESPYTRARVAIYGIWGLPPSEALYFSSAVDSARNKLDRRCAYQVKGGPLPARWWSLTAYRDGFYIDNPASRYSWSMTDAQIDPDGRWTIHLSPDGGGVNGLALGHKDGKMLLLLRLYEPNPGIAEHRERVLLPSIEKTSC